jgi:hypothetical protein
LPALKRQIGARIVEQAKEGSKEHENLIQLIN